MFDTLGRSGVLGVVLLLVGIGLVAWESLLLAAGMALVVAGLGLVVQGIIRSRIRSMSPF